MTCNPDWHPEDVKAMVRKSGASLSELARRNGYVRSSFHTALKRPWPKIEAIIARHLHRQPWTIWPSRYDARNKPLKRPYIRKHTQDPTVAHLNFEALS